MLILVSFPSEIINEGFLYLFDADSFTQTLDPILIPTISMSSFHKLACPLLLLQSLCISKVWARKTETTIGISSNEGKIAGNWRLTELFEGLGVGMGEGQESYLELSGKQSIHIHSFHLRQLSFPFDK